MADPISLYIHWPFCRKKCPYCDFNSHVRDEVEQLRWRDALLQELRWQHAQASDRELVSIFFGGGTPSLMPPETVAALIEEAKRLWPHDHALEVTLEANPTSAEATKFKGFAEAGVNRISMGIQALKDDDLRFLGREHSVKEALAAFDLARATVPRTSFDLIYARPGQTVAGWEAELREALRHTDDHLSVYQLTIEENTAFHSAYAKGAFALPEEELARQLYDATQAVLEEAGLPAYEISNHARPGRECRHNLTYWRGDEYFGIGPGVHGRFRASGQPVGHRTATVCQKSPERWLSSVEQHGHGRESAEAVPVEEEVEARLMMGLRLTEGLTWERLENLRPEVRRHLQEHPRFQQLQTHGLLDYDASRLWVGAQGRPVLNSLLGELAAMLEPHIP